MRERQPKVFTTSKPAELRRTPISAVDPRGFGKEEVKMSKLDSRSDEVKRFVGEGNKQRFKIGVAVAVRNGRDGSIHGGHAFVSVEELPPGDSEQRFIVDYDKPLKDHDLSPNGAFKLYRVHISFRDQALKDMLELGWDEQHKSIRVKYIPICTITTTIRYLKQIALRSVDPGDHSIVVNDCATVARNFIEGLLDRLGCDGIITPEQMNEYKSRWLKEINIEDGSAGESEGESRDFNRGWCTVM